MRICHGCGKQNRPEVKFCGYCGAVISGGFTAKKLGLGAAGLVLFGALGWSGYVAWERPKKISSAIGRGRQSLSAGEFNSAAAEFQKAVKWGSGEEAGQLLEDARQLSEEKIKLEAKGMLLIPAGEFQMGSPEGVGASDEHPRHRVYLDSYYMDKYEVTNNRYMEFVRAVGKHLPEWMEPGGKYNTETGDDKGRYKNTGDAKTPGSHPVVGVSWYDAAAYCKWAGGRLPTEAEWEKAARGGTNTKWSFGDDKITLDEYAWSTRSNDRTHPVGQKKPNQYGLYDMHGNVWEWVSDSWNKYKDSPVNNPKTDDLETFPSGSPRGLRGGSWGEGFKGQRSALRKWAPPELRWNDIGIRCVVPARHLSR